MPFKFSWLCELLEGLNQQNYQQRSTYSRQDNPSHRIVLTWYSKYTDRIIRTGPPALALLSALLPERRPDRTYNLREKRLTQIFGRALSLGASRLKALQSWQAQDGQDLPTLVERVMAESENHTPHHDIEVTLEEIDLALTRIAANTLSSGPTIRAQADGVDAYDVLAPIIWRLSSKGAKWLVRMILKSYSPVEIPEYAALYGFHFMLPKLLTVQNSLEAAIAVLASPELKGLPPRTSKDYETALLPIMAKAIIPQLGTMIQRQPLEKARSIKHCVNMAGSRTMSVERKYDGEYCQIHVDLRRGLNCIVIFAKSGRDSTADRQSLMIPIKAALRIGQPECKIKTKAILEGELLVYKRGTKQILPFYHIRKHVRHGGRRIGTEKDSPRREDEHLIIAFFDVLLLDDKVMISEPHSSRRSHLKSLVKPIEGVSILVERVMIDFKSRRAPGVLREAFGVAIRRRWEGFVLKGLDDPYFSWTQDTRAIKLKKDYIAGLGDTADLCIVGGHRDARIEATLGLGRLWWTSFHVAALLNEDSVRRYDVKPILKILDCLGPGALPNADILALNQEGKLSSMATKGSLESTFLSLKNPRKDLPGPTDIYTRPIVVEIMGAGYERPQCADFYILRFPRRVGSRIKLHCDRDIADTVSFDELQAMAVKSLQEVNQHASQEDVEWIERLLAADPVSKFSGSKSQSMSPYKTLHSVTTASLTPAGATIPSIQSPMLVRVDSNKRTPVDWQAGYPDSAPQPRTPSRQSETTISPNSVRRRSSCMRNSSTVDDSPTKAIVHKKRRTESATAGQAHNNQREALTKASDQAINTRVAPAQTQQPRKQTPPDRPEERPGDLSSGTTRLQYLSSSHNSMNPPVNNSTQAIGVEVVEAIVFKSHQKAALVQDIFNTSLNESSTALAVIEPSTPATATATATAPAPVESNNLPAKPDDTRASTPAEQSSSLLRHLIYPPIWLVTSSGDANHEQENVLRAIDFDFTTSRKDFAKTMLTEVLRYPSLLTRFVALFDSETLSDAALQIKGLAKELGDVVIEDKIVLHPVRADIVILTYDVLDEEFAKCKFDASVDVEEIAKCQPKLCALCEVSSRKEGADWQFVLQMRFSMNIVDAFGVNEVTTTTI